MTAGLPAIDAIDRSIIAATQSGLPLTSRPYQVVAEQLGLDPADVLRRCQRMLDTGIIRRVALVPNHYALGYRANGMSVWNVSDAAVTDCGKQIGTLDFVSHCYRRPRHLPAWPYNFFAMVHGRNRPEVEFKVEQIAALLGAHDRGHSILYSTRILKKTGFRLHQDRRG